MNKITVTLQDGSTKELLPPDQLTQEKWRYVVVFVDGVDELIPYLGLVAVNEDDSIEIVNRSGLTTAWLDRDHIYGFYYTEPIGMQFRLYRKFRKRKNGSFMLCDTTQIDYVPDVVDYYDQWEERVERMNHENSLFEYSWGTRYIFQEDEWL